VRRVGSRACSTWSRMSHSFQKLGFLEITDSEPVLCMVTGMGLTAAAVYMYVCVCVCVPWVCIHPSTYVHVCVKKCVCAFPASFVVWPDKCGSAPKLSVFFNLTAILLSGVCGFPPLSFSWQLNFPRTVATATLTEVYQWPWRPLMRRDGLWVQGCWERVGAWGGGEGWRRQPHLDEEDG